MEISVRAERIFAMSEGKRVPSNCTIVSKIFRLEVSQMSFTLVGLPCWIFNQPSRAKRCNTSRNVVRVTPILSANSRSAGKSDPGGK